MSDIRVASVITMRRLKLAFFGCACAIVVITYSLTNSNAINVPQTYEKLVDESTEPFQYFCNCTRKPFYSPPPKFTERNRHNSTCSDEGTFYQVNQNVVSFSLHYSRRNFLEVQSRYMKGIILNLETMRKYLPGYSMRIYTNIPPRGELCEMYCNNSDLFWCDIRRTPSLGDQYDMFFMTWRFLPLGDPTVDILLSRDLDSVITAREAAVIQDWIEMDERKAIHVMRDIMIWHDLPILGGLWGARNSLLGDYAVKLQEQFVNSSRMANWTYGADQEILNWVLFYPHTTDIVAYDSYNCEKWESFTLIRPFPTKREEGDGWISDFVGNANFGVGKRKDFVPCPSECRPSYGKNWTYC